MSFFKKYNGTTNARLARLETLIWVFIYGGLLAGLVGWFMRRGGDGDGEWLLLAAGLGVVTGVVLVAVRARLHEGPDPGTKPAHRPDSH